MKGIAFNFVLVGALAVTIGMGWGLHMAATHDHTFSGAHAHLNLVGFVTMTIYGFYYHMVPAAAAKGLAKIHFVVALVGVAIMIPGIAMAIKADMAMGAGEEVSGLSTALAPIGSIIVFVGMLIFVATILSNKLRD